jgi:RNA polymerase sigma-70 factor, ECF subfamily
MLALSDQELVSRCKKELPSNTHSYEELVKRHMNRVHSIVYRIVNNKEESEDITQEVFVKVFNNLNKFEQQAAFSSWLYRIATNSALDALEKNKRQTKNFTFRTSKQNQGESETVFAALNLQASPESDPEEKAMQKELRDCINRVLKKLDREHAYLLIMRDFDDLSYDEIAKAVAARLGAVKMRIHRARLAFREIFSQSCGKIYLAASTSPFSSFKRQPDTKGK